ncbi:metal-sulfur cluster assembly factor [Agrilactobacillus fermenti]|uniref:metal-sulfur cluster assembly factor n=1 Tax=Agrilactobacillus fermenti TaxID=2586909 RepID=UPI001E2F0D61|nr:metal-sulfur cluster assembly factor [Agrilactobacillus fermenti]MCD2255828.1 metal-sulfur cluster assembly factor [Agrilactobacillus fermenti]
MAEEEKNNATTPETQATDAASNDIKDRILGALETVIDPELGIDIVNLGLIYDISLDKDGLCTINMTLTTMGCPLSDLLTEQINQALSTVPEVKDVDVQLVWYPQWTTERMSRYARIALGIR